MLSKSIWIDAYEGIPLTGRKSNPAGPMGADFNYFHPTNPGNFRRSRFTPGSRKSESSIHSGKIGALSSPTG
jgi:hypothetical protein